MKKFINFAHCSRHRLVREIEAFNYSDTSLLRFESSEGMIFVRPDTSNRSFLPIYFSTDINENVEMYAKFKQITQSSQPFTNNGGGLTLCSDSQNTAGTNAIALTYGTQASSGINYSQTWRLNKYKDGNATTLNSGNVTEKTTNQQVQTFKHLKVKKEGSIFKTKTWWDGEVEPVYSAGYAPTELTLSGYYGFELSSRATVLQLQYLAISTGDDIVDMSPPANRTVAGIIYNPDNTIAAGATVRLYHAYTGALLGRVLANENGEYNFTLPILETELVHIVGVDVNGNEWKPPIHETYPVL